MGDSLPSYEIATDGILYITFPPGAVFDVAVARRALEKHLEIAHGRVLPTLVDITRVRSVDREAREIVAGPAIGAVTSRLAILVGGPLSSVIGNFFLRVTRPVYPTRLFSNRDKATSWLLGANTKALG